MPCVIGESEGGCNMHVFLNFSRAISGKKTSWLAHWEQKVGGPALSNRL